MTPLKILILDNHAGAPTSTRDILVEDGHDVDVIKSYKKGALPKGFNSRTYDLVIIHGGPQGAHQVELYDYLDTIVQDAQMRHAEGRPTLGICLGFHLLALALGGKSIKGPPGELGELGWKALDVNAEGRKTAVRHFDFASTGVKAFESHDDTITLPPGAIRLAGSDKFENQAFVLDDITWGVQNHFEITPEGLDSFEAGCAKPVGAGKADLAQLRADNVTYGLPGMVQGRKFMRELIETLMPAIERVRQWTPSAPAQPVLIQPGG